MHTVKTKQKRNGDPRFSREPQGKVGRKKAENKTLAISVWVLTVNSMIFII